MFLMLLILICFTPTPMQPPTGRLLPPAYVVRREGNSFILLVCPHLGGVPISHNALQHFPECHGADTGGEGTLPGPAGGGGVPCQVQLRGGGTQLGQQKEYSLHGGRYASCVHAGGLSCNAVYVHIIRVSSRPDHPREIVTHAVFVGR